MRNWNPLLHQRGQTGISVFSVPMRNWNLVAEGEDGFSHGFSAYLWGIETNTLSAREARPGGFQRTYEELKQAKLHFIFGGSHVFSVPMRNWNSGKSLMKFIMPSMFSAYLWGIETAIATTRCHRRDRFSAYLWGIETRKVITSYTFIFSFQRTYGELKPFSCFPAPFWLLCFQRTYEELKLLGLHLTRIAT